MTTVDAAQAPLDPAALFADARALTGLIDSGAPDIGEGLAVLLDSLNREGRLSAAGLEAQRAALTGMLANRLRIEDALRRHPEIARETLRGPIVIVGLPRSGTTKLQRMMAANPALQSLPLWRILNPVPSHAARDDRIAIAEQVSAGMRAHFPDFIAGHPMDTRDADEEVFLADLVLRGWNPTYAAHTPTFDAWLQRQEFDVWYAFLRRLLQLYQWQNGSPGTHWLLKTCEHLAWIEDLARHFPGATIVHCHRDPVLSIPSIAALTVASRRMYSDHVDPVETGTWILDHWSWHMRRYLARRPALEGTLRFVDVAYREITDDALATIERILGVAGVAVDDTGRDAMLAWEAANPPGKHGQHRYALDTHGYDAAGIRAAFADYIARFGAFM